MPELNQNADLVERLRHAATTAANDDLTRPMTQERRRHTDRVVAMSEAADALETQAAEISRLRDALADMVQRFELYAGPNDIHAGHHDKALLDRARTALEANHG